MCTRNSSITERFAEVYIYDLSLSWFGRLENLEWCIHKENVVHRDSYREFTDDEIQLCYSLAQQMVYTEFTDFSHHLLEKDDLVMYAYNGAVKGFSKCPNQDKLKSYMYTSAKRSVIDELRVHKKEEFVYDPTEHEFWSDVDNFTPEEAYLKSSIEEEHKTAKIKMKERMLKFGISKI